MSQDDIDFIAYYTGTPADYIACGPVDSQQRMFAASRRCDEAAISYTRHYPDSAERASALPFRCDRNLNVTGIRPVIA